MGLEKVDRFPNLTQVSPVSRGMASTPTRNEEKGSRMSQVAAPSDGGLVSMGVSQSGWRAPRPRALTPPALRL